jgi:monofunctional biosynthetic peptidoglycan transglycosylase
VSAVELGRRAWSGLFAALVSVTATYLGVCVAALIAYTSVWPPVTGLQLQRQVEAWQAGQSYQVRQTVVPLEAVDADLARAAVAAEDTRFFEHWGIDWKAVSEAVEDNLERGRAWRGGSTITQQLVKNLFLTSHSSYLRKALEVPLTYAAEAVLSKRRILELYLNVIEWGPGVFGVHAATAYHYGTGPDRVTRYRAAALAACIPDPLNRRPAVMDRYTQIILERMRRLGPLPVPL